MSVTANLRNACMTDSAMTDDVSGVFGDEKFESAQSVINSIA
jgi:hypothetical protein